jgi:hypothetical protein
VSKTYYYVKPKTSGGITYRKPEIEQPKVAEFAVDYTKPAPQAHSSTLYSSRHIEQPDNHAVLDLSFGAKSGAAAVTMTHAVSGVSFGRLAIASLAVVALYLGGFAIYAQASDLRTEITGLATKGVAKLEAGATALSVKDFQKATDNFTAAENLFAQANQELLDLGQTNLYLSGLAGNNFKIITGIRLVDSGLNLAQGGKALITAMTPTFQYFNALETQPVAAADVPKQIVGLLTTARPNLDQAIGKVGKANALLTDIDTNNIDADYRSAIEEAQVKTASLQQAVTVLGTLAQELPDALGFNNPRKYLLLNQNSNEIRATGGFIGSFTILTIYKGQIEKQFVDITQRVDGQNPRSDLELPAPLRSISQTGTFGTRDSNWYADFPTSARTFQKLYEEGGGGTMDGIIAVNPTLITSLLNITGPIELPIKQETITADNFVSITQEYAEIIDNKKENPKEILGELAPIMMERLMALSSADLAKVNEILIGLLNTKEMMIYTRNPKLESVLTTLNFAGVMPDVVPNQDFLAIVRSNLGGKKSSGSVAAKVVHNVAINLAEDVESTLQFSFTHQGSNEFPDGPNKDYIRIYAPKGSKLIGASGQDDGTQPDVSEEGDKTVFGIWLTTNPGETKTLNIKYRPNVRIDNSYNLFVFKQSADNSWFTSTLRTSAALGIDGDLSNKSKAFYDGKLTGDQSFAASLMRAD